MPINTSAFIELTSDVRYDVLKKGIKVDKDNKAYELQFIPPATGMAKYSKTDVVDVGDDCYNADGSLGYIDIYCGSDYKANMQGTFIVLDYQCVQARKPAGDAYKGTLIAPTQVDGTGVGWSMPWNTLTFFSTAALKLNQSQTPVEQYINTGVLDHITTARFLKKYKKEALENNDMTFNTPCIESKFDNTTMSAESAMRAVNWMGASGASDAASAAATTTLRTYEKIIPLADLFESCENPGIWTNTNRFRFEYTLKLPDAIPFRCGAAAAGSSAAYVFVKKIGLMFDSTRMQAVQAIETAAEKQEGSIENIAYLENFCLPIQYTNGQQLVATGQRDVQELILGFPAKGATVDGAVGVNPIQYYSGNLGSLSVMYGSDLPLRTPLSLAGILTAYNTAKRNGTAYALYRKSCGADRAAVVPLALNFTDYNIYHLYFLPIYNPILPHRNNDPKDLRVDTSSGTTGNAVMIIRKFAGAQVDSTGAVEKL